MKNILILPWSFSLISVHIIRSLMFVINLVCIKFISKKIFNSVRNISWSIMFKTMLICLQLISTSLFFWILLYMWLFFWIWAMLPFSYSPTVHSFSLCLFKNCFVYLHINKSVATSETIVILTSKKVSNRLIHEKIIGHIALNNFAEITMRKSHMRRHLKAVFLTWFQNEATTNSNCTNCIRNYHLNYLAPPQINESYLQHNKTWILFDSSREMHTTSQSPFEVFTTESFHTSSQYMRRSPHVAAWFRRTVTSGRDRRDALGGDVLAKWTGVQIGANVRCVPPPYRGEMILGNSQTFPNVSIPEPGWGCRLPTQERSERDVDMFSCCHRSFPVLRERPGRATADCLDHWEESDRKISMFCAGAGLYGDDVAGNVGGNSKDTMLFWSFVYEKTSTFWKNCLHKLINLANIS